VTPSRVGASRVGSCSVLVQYCCTGRSEEALARAVAYCVRSHARLGIAVTAPWFAHMGMPWMVAPHAVVPTAQTCRYVLRKVPDELPVKFLLWPHPAGLAEIADFARRLQCDSVLLPMRGWRLRHAARVLSRSGLLALDAELEPVYGNEPVPARRLAIRPAS
jgi:hypothetical protein